MPDIKSTYDKMVEIASRSGVSLEIGDHRDLFEDYIRSFIAKVCPEVNSFTTNGDEYEQIDRLHQLIKPTDPRGEDAGTSPIAPVHAQVNDERAARMVAEHESNELQDLADKFKVIHLPGVPDLPDLTSKSCPEKTLCDEKNEKEPHGMNPENR